jgi:hypothetical protein
MIPPSFCPGTPLSTNLQLHLLSWSACYVPGSELDSLGGRFMAREGALLPDSASVLAGAADGDGEAQGSALGDLQRTLRGQDLSQLRAYIGVPAQRPPAHGGSEAEPGSAAGSADPSGTAEQPAPADGQPAAAMDDDTGMQGVRQYEPEAGELVVLLATRIDGKPATGAELLVVARSEDGCTTLELPDGWEAALAAA